MEKKMSLCPCGSEKDYAECCEPYIRMEVPVPTAEALMRSRYSAYTLVEMDYLFETTHPSQREDYDAEGAKQWAESSEWLGFEILGREKGEENDSEGVIEFAAHFAQNGTRYTHHERSIFRKDEGKWYFFDGEAVTPQTYRREGAKIGRNDACPCGSGKKYKKCCMDKAS